MVPFPNVYLTCPPDLPHLPHQPSPTCLTRPSGEAPRYLSVPVVRVIRASAKLAVIPLPPYTVRDADATAAVSLTRTEMRPPAGSVTAGISTA